MTENYPRIIGITGAKESGKDTAYLLLAKMAPYERRAFADPLREEIEPILLGHAPIPDDLPPQLFVWMMAQLLENDDLDGMDLPPILFQKPYTERMRKIQQWWGTEYRRQKYGDDYWLRKFEEYIDARPGKLWAVTDVRFPNEAECIRKNGGIVWRITNPKTDNRMDSHESERNINLIRPDVVIPNDDSLDVLSGRIRDALTMSMRSAAA